LADTTLAFDVRHATVSGDVTLGGAPLPDSPDVDTRGLLRFDEVTGVDSYAFGAGATGAASFSGLLFHGEYDVTFEVESVAGLMGLPAGKFARLAEGLAVTGDVARDYDLRLVSVSGTLTLNGGALTDSPDVTNRGYVRYTNRATRSVHSFAIAPTGVATYAGAVFAGDYDVTFAAVDEAGLLDLPRGDVGLLQKERTVTADSVADYDLKTVSVVGTVTTSGAPMPDSPDISTRGGLWFEDLDTGTFYYASVGNTGAASYGAFLFAGTYNVSFETAAESGLVGLPRDTLTDVAPSVAFAQDQTADYDLELMNVTGTVTVNGAPMPDSPEITSRAGVRFRDLANNAQHVFYIGPTGAGTFSGMVFAGNYEVTFETTSDTPLIGLPAYRYVGLESTLAINEAQTLSYDVKPVTVSGSVTLAGAAMPDSPEAETRGSVRFVDLKSGEAYTFNVGNVGPAAYGGTVFASDYRVNFDSGSSGPLVGLPFDSTTRLASRVAVTADQSTDFDVRVVTVSGVLTANGAAMPDSPELETRGRVLFDDKLNTDQRTFSLPSTGAGSFTGLLFAGTYDVAFETESASALVGLPFGARTNLATGCMPTSVCEEPLDDLSGFWTFRFSGGGFGTITAFLTQQGESLTGPLHAPAFPLTSVFHEGRVNGSEVFLRATFPGGSCAPFEITATLTGACGLQGKVYCGGYATAPTVVGFR
jgi:hypothetical protein